MFRTRPQVRFALLLVPVLLILAVVGFGLIRAATFRPSVPGPASTGADAVAGPVAGRAGRCGDVPAQADRELRGFWLTTVENIDFPSRPGLPQAQVKAEYEHWLDIAVAQHYNAIFVHVRPDGDAFWPSAYAPWSQWLTGNRGNQSPGWDPLAYMVGAAHARNLEFHAWFNPYRDSQPAPEGGAGTDFSQLSPGNALLKHRDWAIAYPTGTTGRFYFDPGNPAARRYVEDSMLEAVRNYDVDGVHFDDFFYPYPEKGQDFPDSASYAKYGNGADRAAWRRGNVDTMIHEMSTRIKQLKPWVQFGVSPFGIWRNKDQDPAGSDSSGLSSYDAQYADTRTWVREGWLDYVVPQLYWNIGFAKADYAKLLAWWANLVKGTKVQLYIGQADYRIGEPGAWSDPGQIDKQMTLNTKFGVRGEIHFSAASVRSDKLGAVTRYSKDHYANPALPPVLPSLPATPPSTPRLSALNADGTFVSVTARSGPPAVSWALYRVEGPAAALVATGRVGAAIADPHPPSHPATYCLSTFDRTATESPLSPPFSTTAG